ncbi:hypothetical protein LEP1GSC060_0076 [Leptospira weilii serovar Ranarum str. ICFT]|uniref:Nucleoside 2-deoxyribosyltransferase n=1 Tax=Leptospira weilii serovar Ranarum str. ICFT TaxID=1218598 RepID=N1W830_9LEPT|nr:hypothetical protein [Leptospira weilii]EMY76386.1 hypothetical protein LEP1GSC060_0076 [Leptospira weilii serovar Ranarum str. ICFT]
MQSFPSIQNFFSFSPELKIEQIISTISYIKSLLPDDIKLSGMIKSNQKVFSPIETLESFQNIFIQCNGNVDLMQINFMGTGERIIFIFQFVNEITGPNGNYTIESGSEDLNNQIETILRAQLKLEKMRFDVYNRKEELVVNPIFKNRNFTLNKHYAFVLMPFTEIWSDLVWEKIKHQVTSLNFKCKRADDLSGHNVLEDIWTGINEANLIIADLTNKNPNVFYEIGIAHTLGKRVILITQDEGTLPFDFRIYRVIFYTSDEDGLSLLSEQLTKFITNSEKL